MVGPAVTVGRGVLACPAWVVVTWEALRVSTLAVKRADTAAVGATVSPQAVKINEIRKRTNIFFINSPGLIRLKPPFYQERILPDTELIIHRHHFTA